MLKIIFLIIFLNSRNEYHHSKYKQYRNKLKHLIALRKKTYYNDYFKTYSDNIKATWRGITELISFKVKTNNAPNKILKGDKIITETKAITNAFNDCFSSIGSSLASAIPSTQNSFTSYLSDSISNAFFITPVTQSEIQNEISKLNQNKAVGPFSIPVNILKLLSHIVSKPLEISHFEVAQGIGPS